MDAMDELGTIRRLHREGKADEALRRMTVALMRGDAPDHKTGYTAANAAHAAADYLAMPVEAAVAAVTPSLAGSDFVAFLHYLEEQGATASTVIYAVEKPAKFWEQYADYLVSDEDGNLPVTTPLAA